MVAVNLNLRRSRTSIRHVTYRNIKSVNPAEFAKLICSEKICTCPPVDTDAFADDLDASVTRPCPERIGTSSLTIQPVLFMNTICASIQRLFWQKKRRQWTPLQSVVAYASPNEFVLAMGMSIVQRSLTAGWTGESTLKLGLIGR